jgi:hypothetical protein
VSRTVASRTEVAALDPSDEPGTPTAAEQAGLASPPTLQREDSYRSGLFGPRVSDGLRQRSNTTGTTVAKAMRRLLIFQVATALPPQRAATPPL